MLDELLETGEPGSLALPFNERCRHAIAVGLLRRLIVEKSIAVSPTVRRYSPEIGKLIAKLDVLPPETARAIDDWVAKVSIRTAPQRMAVARCFDNVVALTRPLARARVGEGPGAATVVELMLELAQIQAGESVLDPCFGAGELLAPYLWPAQASARMTAFAHYPGAYLIGLTRALLVGVTLDLRFGDALDPPFIGDAIAPDFDCILLAPQWGERLDNQVRIDDFPVPARLRESVSLLVAMKCLRPGGRAVMLTSEGLLFRQDSELKIRNILLKSFALEDVVSLPSNTFDTTAQIKPSLLVFSRRPSRATVRFSRCIPEALPEHPEAGRSPAASFVAALWRGALDPRLCTEIPREELMLRGNVWIVDRELELRDLKPELAADIQRLFPAARVVSLGEVAQILSGITPEKEQKVEARPPPPGSLGLIAITQLRDGTLGTPAVYVHSDHARTISEKCLQAGDVLLSIKTKARKVALVPVDRPDLSAADALVIIRPDPRQLLSEFLVMLLRRDVNQQLLRVLALGGTGLKRVPVLDIKLIQIPLPSLASQAESIGRLAAQTPADTARRRAEVPADEESASDEVFTPGEGQGLPVDSRLRQAIEHAAMAAAEAYFRAAKYTVKSVGRPFDLLCTRGDEVLYVEVKGTTGSAKRIVLTHGELKHNRRHPKAMALFVLHSLQRCDRDGTPAVSGGTEIVIEPWLVDEALLEPLSYWYRLADEGRPSSK